MRKSLFTYKGWHVTRNGDKGWHVWRPTGSGLELAASYGKEVEYAIMAIKDCVKMADKS